MLDSKIEFWAMNFFTTLQIATASRRGKIAVGSGPLAWRPLHLAPSEEMEVEVGHCFASLGAAIDHDSEALFEKSLLTCDDRDEGHEVAQELGVLGLGLTQPCQRALGDQQEVRGSLWLNIPKTEGFLVFIDDFGGDFSSNNFLKKGVLGHLKESWNELLKFSSVQSHDTLINQP